MAPQVRMINGLSPSSPKRTIPWISTSSKREKVPGSIFIPITGLCVTYSANRAKRTREGDAE